MRYYIGLIHKDADSDYGVSFPDFPGVITAGTSLDDAQALAEEALTLHVDGLVEDGEALPEPSTLDAVMELPDSRRHVTLPEDILERIDKSRRVGRSAFLTSFSKRAHAARSPYSKEQQA